MKLVCHKHASITFYTTTTCYYRGHSVHKTNFTIVHSQDRVSDCLVGYSAHFTVDIDRDEIPVSMYLWGLQFWGSPFSHAGGLPGGPECSLHITNCKM